MFKHLRAIKIQRDTKDNNLRRNYFKNYKTRSENLHISRKKCNHNIKKEDPMTDKRSYCYVKTDPFYTSLKGRHKKIASKKGKNKKTNLYNILPLCSKQPYEGKNEIKHHEFSINIKYKNNSRKPTNPELPICLICCHNNAGRGKYIFKNCIHGKEMCLSCASSLFNCPFCRQQR
tara:strand:- start:186 stop:710 length:525 start_codon:yes stop_codon:yes gene_type:complete